MSGAHWRRRVALVTLLSLSSGCVGVTGCSPSGAAAAGITKSSATPAAEPASPAAPIGGPKPGPAKPATTGATEALPGYVLPFEARANPFAPAEPKPSDRPAAATAQAADVKLVGLMRDGSGSMAVVEVDGQQFVVFAGTSLEPASGVEGLRIVEIGESEIVVEQSGRQWIVALPQP